MKNSNRYIVAIKFNDLSNIAVSVVALNVSRFLSLFSTKIDTYSFGEKKKIHDTEINSVAYNPSIQQRQLKILKYRTEETVFLLEL